MNYYYSPGNYSRPHKGKHGKRSLRLSLLVIIFFLTLVSYTSLVWLRFTPTGAVELFDISVDKNIYNNKIIWPNTGQAAISLNTKSILFKSQTKEEPRPIASLAKVITVLAVLEKAPMKINEAGITLHLNSNDEELYRQYLAKDGSVTPVKAGDKLSQYHAMQTILLPSSNNMTDSLVNRVFGSINDYVVFANAMISRYGLSKTHIADASGFSPHTVSTPSEMVTIAKKALDNQVISEIIMQKQATIPGVGTIRNANHLLDIENVIGIKPGNTDEAGWCLLFASRVGSEAKVDNFLVGAIMGSRSSSELYDSAKSMLESSTTTFESSKVLHSEQKIGEYYAPWTGSRYDIVAKGNVATTYTSVKELDLEFVPNETRLPLTADEVIGKVEVGKGTKVFVPVAVQQEIPKPSIFWKLQNIF